MQQFHDILFNPKALMGVQVDHVTGRVKLLLDNAAVATTIIPLGLFPEALEALQTGKDFVGGVTTTAVTATVPSPPKFQLNQCCMLRNIYQQWLMGQIRSSSGSSYQIDVPGFGKLWTRTEKELLPICDPSTLQVHDKVVLCDGDFKTTIYVEGQIEFLDAETDHCIVKRLDGSRPYEGSIDEIVAKLPPPPR